MQKFFSMLLLVYIVPGYATKNGCLSEVANYKVVKNSVYSFFSGNKPACFFAFYVKNPDPMVDIKGTGNNGDSIWYGYYEVNKPEKINEFPKPADNQWSNICSIIAVSFYDMNGDKIPDVTVIGSCDKQNAVNYNFPLVFIRKDERYILDKNSYSNLYGMIALSIPDVRAYMAFPEIYYPIFSDRYQLNK